MYLVNEFHLLTFKEFNFFSLNHTQASKKYNRRSLALFDIHQLFSYIICSELIFNCFFY